MLLSAQQLPLAYEGSFTIDEALSLLSPVECSPRRWPLGGQFAPLQRGNLEAQRGWACGLKIPSQLQNPDSEGPHPVLRSCSELLLCFHSTNIVRPSIISAFRTHISSHLNVQSNLATCSRTAKRGLCSSKPPSASCGMECKTLGPSGTALQSGSDSGHLAPDP